MTDLNKMASEMLANAEVRQRNGANIATDAYHMLKHCATEVVEAADAWAKYVDERAKLETEYYGYLDFQAEKTELLKGKFASELADIIACCLIIAGREEIDIECTINDCIEKNKRRAEGVGDKL